MVHMADHREKYTKLRTVQWILALIVATTSTIGSPGRGSGAGSTLGFLGFVGWTTIAIIMVEELIWSWAINQSQQNQSQRMMSAQFAKNIFYGHILYLSLYTLFWFSGAVALSVATSRHNCYLTVQRCDQARAAAAFSWFYFIAIFVNMLYVAAINGRSDIRLGFLVMNSLGRPQNQTVKAPEKVPNIKQVHLESGTYKSGHISQEMRCVQCNNVACEPDSIFCSAACSQASRIGAPKLLLVPPHHVMHQFVVERFAIEWRHPRPRPTVRSVYAIISTEENDRLYRAYRDTVDRKGSYSRSGMKPGNEQLRWHGTTRRCTLGDGQQQLCAHPDCSLCNIIAYSFDIDRYGPKWGRFGKGIYSSSTSSKAHDYSKNLSPSPYMALLLNNVVIGKGRTLYENSSQLTEPPPSYDSVLGEPGVHLNYDETVVYRNDSIRPAYLVIYDDPNRMVPD